jgi:hypothetical protein
MSRRRWLHHSTSIGDNYNGGGDGSVGGGGGSSSQSSQTTPTAVAVPLDVDEIIEILFAPRWRGGVPPPPCPSPSSAGSNTNTRFYDDDLAQPPPSFPTNVPLPQMVDVLVDLWEAEGLDL